MNVFDAAMQKMDKQKAMDKLSFPALLDVPSVLASVALDNDAVGHAVVGTDGQPVQQYELVAVLIHKGTSASHGHYGKHAMSCNKVQ